MCQQTIPYAELETWRSRALKAENELVMLRREYEAYRPKLPQPVPLTLDPKSTALLVLDVTNRCNNPEQVCSRLAPRIKDFLPKARQASVYTIFSIMHSSKDTPQGKVWDGFGVLPGEPIIAPDSIDKFMGGELAPLLQEKNIKTVIVTGFSTNNCILFTATNAARMQGYNVIVPLDGVIADGDYASEYPIHQFTITPSGASKLFSFTTLKEISFHESI